MSTEQREKDLKFLAEAAQMADGVEALSKQLEKARLVVLVTDNARLKAHLEDAPQDEIQRRAAAHSVAQMVFREVEEHYHEATRNNADYLRKEALK